ncbi:MAG TPA: hypothetical protein VNS55_00705 [Nocardioides sp.]|nr:hypothetical protein [Nocardioides sp.]
MRTRSLALSVTALALLFPLTACSGDDGGDGGGSDSKSSEQSTGEISSGTGEVAGGKKPATTPPTCPFTDKQLDKALGLDLRETKTACIFEQPKGQQRISVTRDAAADNKSYAKEAKTFKEWDNFETLDDVDGQAYVAWSDDELNIAIGYLDNAGAYRYQVSAITPDDAGAADAVDLAEQLIELTVSARKG